MGIEKDPENRIGNRAEDLLKLETAAHLRSHMFTVRLWSEVLGDGRTEWRGQVQHVTTQEKTYFREWSALVLFLERKVSELQV